MQNYHPLCSWKPAFTIIFLLCFCAKAFAIPKAPAGLAAVALSDTSISITWTDAATDETGFEVERSADGTRYAKIADLKPNTVSFLDDSLRAATKYWYRVRAKNSKGFSAYSNIASATTKLPLVTIPPAPTGLRATAISGYQIALSWTDNAANETVVKVERSLNGTAFEKITELGKDAKIYQHTGLQPVTRYWYRVRAGNSAGFSAYSNVADATTLEVAPIAPGELTGSAVSQTRIDISWKDLSNNETGFQIERSLNGTNFTKIADVARNATGYQNTGLSTFTLYYYRVRAFNAAGVSAYSNVISVRTLNIPVPNAPTGLTAVPVAYSVVQLRWAALTGNATSVVIERARNEQAYQKIGTVAATELQFQDTTYLEKDDYYYRIKAINAGGESPYSLLAIVRAQSIITAVEPAKALPKIHLEGKILRIEPPAPGYSVAVYNGRGNLLQTKTGAVTQVFNLTSYPAGIYIVRLQSGQKVISTRILLF